MSDSSFAGLLAARYARRLDVAAVVLIVGWHVAGAGELLLAHRADYAMPGIQAAAWAVLLCVMAAAGVRLLAGRADGGTTGVLVAITSGVDAFVSFTVPHERLLETHWAWGSAGWACVLVLLRRPLRELAILLATQALIVLAALISGPMGPDDVAAFITVLYASASIQFAVVIGARTLDATADEAMTAVNSQVEADERRLIAERVHAARTQRYRQIRTSIHPLLAGLAQGDLDPGDPVVQRRCAVEAARLRRLLAESDDVPNALVHELRSCADIAERRGVAVDVHTVGAIPQIPAQHRRLLAEVVINVLVRTYSRARITVYIDGADLAVGVLADAADVILPSAAVSGVVLSRQRDQDKMWLEARCHLP